MPEGDRVPVRQRAGMPKYRKMRKSTMARKTADAAIAATKTALIDMDGPPDRQAA